ncbi:MAG: hypothetical protein AB7D33_04130 [Sphingobium sp.]|jgi:hypothetical protein
MAIPIDRESVRAALAEWASEGEQRRLWLSDGANGAEVSSFSEARESLFTDTGIDLDRGHVVFDATADAKLKKLDALISQIDANREPSQIIADPQMREIRVLASSLLDLIPASPA